MGDGYETRCKWCDRRSYGSDICVDCWQTKVRPKEEAESAELRARIAQLEKQLSDEQQWRVDAQRFGDKLQAEVGELKGLLRRVRRQLHQWADESYTGGWSTHQVQPQRNLAAAIQQFLDKQD